MIRWLIGGFLKPLTMKLRAEAGFLVLLAVAGVGAWLYVQFQQVRADRDDALHRAETICARLGADWAATPGAKRGARCAARAAELAAFKATADQETARILADAVRDASARSAADLQAARGDAGRMRDALAQMETANAEADHRDQVDRDWTAAVNRVAGLHPTR